MIIKMKTYSSCWSYPVSFSCWRVDSSLACPR